MDESVGSELAGITRWLTVHDDLLRGLTHALSNRVGTIAATAYLAEMQPASLASTAATLREEGDRLEQLLHLLRLLPRRAANAAEPVIVNDVVTQAIALQAYHPTEGDVPVSVQLDGDVQPAYIEPGVFVMALSVLIGAGQRAARRTGLDDGNDDGRVVLTVSSNTETVVIAARGHRGDGPVDDTDALIADDVSAVRWLLGAWGGTAASTSGGATLHVPTLQAARRAQRG